MKLFSDLNSFLYGISLVASGHLDTQGVHGILELDTVFTSLDGVNLDTYDLYVVFLENACF